ncbi:YveK family protein [Planomicrobium okeanokoites]|uniref:YveK family protein n=1 Tax=Planomicrobium okeanokoites TaxID=244 RepID=UPI0030F772E5
MAEKVMVFNILKSLKNHVKLIAGVSIVSMGAIWALLTFILAPNYQATSQLYIEQPTAGLPEAGQVEKSADPQVVEAYSVMIKSREVLASAIEETDVALTPAELFEKVTVSNVPASQVLSITVEDKDRRIAGELANSLANFAVAEGWKLMKADNLEIIAKASVEEVPSVLEENVLYVLAIGGIFGAIVGILMSFIAELFNMLFSTGVLQRKRKQSNLQTVFK